MPPPRRSAAAIALATSMPSHAGECRLDGRPPRAPRLYRRRRDGRLDVAHMGRQPSADRLTTKEAAEALRRPTSSRSCISGLFASKLRSERSATIAAGRLLYSHGRSASRLHACQPAASPAAVTSTPYGRRDAESAGESRLPPQGAGLARISACRRVMRMYLVFDAGGWLPSAVASLKMTASADGLLAGDEIVVPATKIYMMAMRLPENQYMCDGLFMPASHFRGRRINSRRWRGRRRCLMTSCPILFDDALRRSRRSAAASCRQPSPDARQNRRGPSCRRRR